MQTENFKNEIYRKLIHLSSIWIPAMLLIKGKQVTLMVTFILLIVMGIFETLRHKKGMVGNIVEKFSIIFRKSELAGTITGASYFLLACFLVTLFFPIFIAVMSLLVLIISDTAAAIIGKKWGKVKFNNKTLEGSSAFFISAVIICILGKLFFSGAVISFAAIIVSCFGTTLFELFAKNFKVDDNLLIPLSFASLMQILI